MLPMLAALALGGTQTLVLSRGISLPNQPFRYWSVQDATLDGANPNSSMGGDYELAGGPGKNLLIRFGDLERATAGKKIVGARLILHVTEGSPALRGVGRVRVDWGEGPVRRPSFMKPQAGEPETPRGAATWRSRLEGVADWQLQGAAGPDDTSAVSDARLTKLDGDEVAIEGLGPAVADMAGKWYENFGFALQFESSVMFESSQAPTHRPRLELTVEDAPAPTGADLAVMPIEVKDSGDFWQVSAKVKNLGTAPSEKFRFLWLNETRGGVLSENPGLAAGGEVTLTNRIAKHKTDVRFASLALRVYPTGPDSDPSNDEAIVYMGGVSVPISSGDWLAGMKAARFVNETLFGQSRFSFARDGVETRVNPVLGEAPSDFSSLVGSMAVKAGAPDLRAPNLPHPYAEGFLGGETRCEALLFPQMSLPSEPYFTPVLDNSGLEPTDLLGMTQVATINGLSPALPKVLLARATNRMGVPYTNVQMTITKVGDTTPTANIPATPSDTVVLPNSIASGDLEHTVYKVTAIKQGISATTYLYGWQILDCGFRGASAAAILDLPLDLPTLELGETNLAEGKEARDSAGRTADALLGLTKEGNMTPIAFSGKRGTWIELDLGRDRSLGELTLLSKKLPKGLDVLTYETGQKPEEAMLWVREVDAEWRLANRSEPGTLVCRPAPIFARFVRIVSRFDQADWELTGIRLRSAKVEQ